VLRSVASICTSTIALVNTWIFSGAKCGCRACIASRVYLARTPSEVLSGLSFALAAPITDIKFMKGQNPKAFPAFKYMGENPSIAVTPKSVIDKYGAFLDTRRTSLTPCCCLSRW
jgi:hypothetical protein